MAHFVKNMREIHNLGKRTREWIVSGRREAALGRTHARYAGYTEATPGYGFVRHDPAFTTLLVTERGEGIVSLGQGWASCPPGYAYVASPHHPHAYHAAPGGDWRLHWLIYWEEGALPGIQQGQEPRLLPVEATGFRHAIEGLYAENSGKADPKLLALWTSLVDHHAFRLMDSDAGRHDARLDQLWLAVQQNLGGHWTLPRLASLAGMSAENLRRLCRHYHGCSPMAHVTRLRMQHAADLLRMSDEKLSSLAARLGYADPFSFSAAFKRLQGKSPKAWRQVQSED